MTVLISTQLNAQRGLLRISQLLSSWPSPAWHSALDLHVQGNLYLSSNQETTGLCLGSSPCAVPGNFLCAVSEANRSTCATVSQLSEIAVLFPMTNVLNTIVSNILFGFCCCCCCFSIILSRKIYQVPVTSFWLKAEIQAMLTF